jgi:hypothetical protein
MYKNLIFIKIIKWNNLIFFKYNYYFFNNFIK